MTVPKDNKYCLNAKNENVVIKSYIDHRTAFFNHLRNTNLTDYNFRVWSVWNFKYFTDFNSSFGFCSFYLSNWFG